MANGHEGLGHAVEAVLWDEPEDGDGDSGSWVILEAVSEGDVLALSLDEASDECGKDGDDEADAHALEEGDTAVEAGEFAGDGDEDAVV